LTIEGSKMGGEQCLSLAQAKHETALVVRLQHRICGTSASVSMHDPANRHTRFNSSISQESRQFQKSSDRSTKESSSCLYAYCVNSVKCSSRTLQQVPLVIMPTS